MKIKEFFDSATSTLTYIVFDETSKDAVVIDPVWDFDPASGALATRSVEELLAFIKESDLRVHWILETHAHADHLSGAQWLKKEIPSAKLGIGASILEVQKMFAPQFSMTKELSMKGLEFDKLFDDRESFQAGRLSFQYFHTPGHTPACGAYRVGKAAFTGDVIFMPDSGTGRCDFPGGSAERMYESIINILYAWPEDTELHVGHDYQPGGRNLKFKASVAEQKKNNIHIKAETSLKDFVEFREARDKTLSAPRLLLPSLQVNIRGGRIPEPDTDGKHFLKIPLSGALYPVSN